MPIFDKAHADMVIALVDDDPDDRFIIKRTLNLMPQRLAAVEYENGQLCLDDFNKQIGSGDQPAEMIILDLNMPIMNGQEFLKKFRSDARFTGVPIVVLTTADDDETHQRARDLGANQCMSKCSDWQGRGLLSQLIIDYWMVAKQRVVAV
ncbi:MAG: response regulator [Hyphomicrobiales bacterium]